jgi:hypothetical protein
MIENPFLTPPQVESPQSRSWASGYIWGFEGPANSSLPQADLAIEDNDAFDQGVLAGQSSAINGLELDNPSCINLNVEQPALLHPLEVKNFPEALDVGLEAGATAYEIAHIGLAAFFGSGILLAVGLSIGLETFSDDPGAVISENATRIQDQLSEMGFTASFSLFVGGAIDPGQAGCELKMTSIFRQLEDAKAAALAMGRPHFVVASWRSDQSGGVEVVASG